ncbi:MAG: glycosyltransferase family 87 protein [Phycisphaeraceae bacterium]
MDRSERRIATVLIGLLLVFGGLFVVRGPLRAVDGSRDLAHLYAASALWLEGGNPYSGEACVERMRSEDLAGPEFLNPGSYYPPPSLAALSPLALVDLATARWFWMGLNLLLCGVLIWALSHWLSVQRLAMGWLIAAVLVVAWGPVATTISQGQLALVPAACAFAGLVLVERRRPWVAGVLLGIACLIKPQLGLGFLLLIGLRREWAALAAGLMVIAGVSAIGVGRLMATVPDWVQQLSANIAVDHGRDEMLDPSPGARYRHQMIDLRPIVYLVVPAIWVGKSVIAIVALLAGIAIWRLMRAGLSGYTLLSVSGVGLLLMLPVYHRYYDAVMLLPLLVLVLNVLRERPGDRLIWLIGLLVLPLVLPLSAALRTLEKGGRLPSGLAETWLWENGVMQHHSWCLLFASVALVVWTWRVTSDRDACRPMG